MLEEILRFLLAIGVLVGVFTVIERVTGYTWETQRKNRR